MKGFSPKSLKRLSDKAFKRAKKTCRRRMKKIAKQGCDYATIHKGDFGREDELIVWLEGLGFRVSDGYLDYAIYWREEK